MTVGEENQEKIMNVLCEEPVKIVLSNLSDKTYLYRKTVVSPKMVKGNLVYQMERFTEKQVFHENVGTQEMAAKILELFPAVYSQMNVFFEESRWDYKMTKKGKLLSNMHRVEKEKASQSKDISGSLVRKKRIRKLA